MSREKINASLTDVTLSNEANKMIITGCICRINTKSEGVPCGADGFNVVITKDAADKCSKTFKEMPVNCIIPDGWFDDALSIFGGHGGSIIGICRKTKCEEDKLMAELVIWKEKLPYGFADMILNAADALGFSIEMYTVQTHDDVINNIRYVDDFEGVGVAMMWSNAAAFSSTYIEKIAAMKAKMGDNNMTKEEIEAIVKASVESAIASHAAEFNKINESITSINASIEKFAAESEANTKEFKEISDKLSAQSSKIEAMSQPKATNIPQPASQPAANPNISTNADGYSEKIEKINSSSMSQLEKLKAITRLRVGSASK